MEVEPLLQELERHGFILRYEVEGEKLIQVLAFMKHQTPHYSEKKSVIKPPPLQESRQHIDKPDSKITPGVDAASRGGRNPLNPDSRILTADPGEKPAARKRAAQPQTVTAADMEAEGVSRQHAVDWLAVRKAKNLPLTPTAWADTKSEAEKAHMTIGEAIKASAAHGWGGFRASWLHGKDQPLNGARTINRQLAVEAENKRVLGEWLGKSQEVSQ